jgi:hypothetical protein
VEVRHSSGKIFRLLNIYNPPSTFSAVPELKNWLTRFYSRQQVMIIAMDANLHHRHWNPPGVRKNEQEARNLLSSLSNFVFRLTSPRHIPTFFSSKGKGYTIDLIWANFLGSKLVASTAVSSENFGSDHQAIQIQLTMKRPSPSYHWSLPKWSGLDKEKIDSISAKLLSFASDAPDDPDIHAEKLTMCLKQAQEHLGRKVQSNKARLRFGGAAKPWTRFSAPGIKHGSGCC